MKMQKKNRGFSLIEIMVVVVIMGMLVAIVGPNVMSALGDAQSKKVQADFSSIETALKLYRLDNFVYPSTEQGLEALVSPSSISPQPKNFRAEGYLPELPTDPWGTEYLYVSSSGASKPYEIYTLGSDGVQGGDGDAKDVTNWDKAE